MMDSLPYLPLALAQVPRLISRLDREPFSRTHGSVDRTYWAWKFTDFPGARFQEAAYSLAALYRIDDADNPLAGHDRVVDWTRAIFGNWQRLQYRDGSFDEAYPFERSLAATAFTGFYLGEAFLALRELLDPNEQSRLTRTFAAAADWLCRNDEKHGVLSNHLAAAAAALAVIHRITGDPRHEDRSRHFLERIYARQSSEGWYEEYGGADPGYQTHGTFYLARVWQLTGDNELLGSLRRSLAFLKHFVHPDGSLGGEYGSRNTGFYFPAGLEIMAPESADAAAIATFMREAVARQRCVGLAAMDAYNFLPMLNNYLAADRAAKENSAALAATPRTALPCQLDGRWDFPEAGLHVVGQGPNFLIVGASKGGVVKLFRRAHGRGRLAASDCGWWIRLADGVASSQALDRGIRLVRDGATLTVEARFARVNQRIMTPWTFLAFRGFCLVLGRSQAVAYRVKALLVKALVSRRKAVPVSIRRHITLDEATFVIEDEIAASTRLRVQEIGRGSRFASIHMGSARYFQPSDLEDPAPAMATAPDPQALERGETLSIRLEWPLVHDDKPPDRR